MADAGLEHKPSAPASSSDRVNEGDTGPEDYYNHFTCKSNLCVICIGLITEYFEDVPRGQSLSSSPSKVSQGVLGDVDTFLQGISVLCEVLNVSNASKFFSSDHWSLGDKRDNFVKLICCQACYKLLANLVSLHQLILTAQATLIKDVQKIESFLLESQRQAVVENREYSVNACVSFREEILKYISKRDFGNSGHDTATKILKLCNQSKTSRLGSKKSTLNLPTPYVKLQRLDILPTANVISHSDTELVSETSNVPSPLGSECNDFDLMNDSDDVKDTPICSHQRGTGRKRGCPKKHANMDGDKTVKVACKRGRPSKSQILKRFHLKMRMTKVSKSTRIKVEEHHDTHEECELDGREQRRKRKMKGFYSDLKPLSDDSNEDVDSDSSKLIPGTQEKPEDGYLPEEEHGSAADSEEDDEYKPPTRSSSLKKPQMKECKTDGKKSFLKKNSGRPLLVGSLRYRYLHEEGPRHKPIYQIGDSINGNFMFYNVKFHKTQYFLQCLHPDCSYLEHFTGYFADQLTFQNFRFHVRHQHRTRYKCVGDESKNFYYCHHCEAQIASRDGLLDHRRTLHPGNQMPPVLCEVCGDVLSQDHIVNHVITHKNKEETEFALAERSHRLGKRKDIIKPICFPCDECNKVFKCHTKLRVHKESHIPLDIRRQWICEICGRKYSGPIGLESHKKRIHLKNLPRPFKCPICSRTYLSSHKQVFDDHVRSHSEDKPYICPHCGKSFHAKRNLVMHEALHNPVSVTCEFCSKVYKTLKYLKRHQYKHHSDLVERPNPEETTKYESEEQRHGIYGPKLMFPCEPCNRVYVYKSMLIAHLKRKHNMQLANRKDYPTMWTHEHHFTEDGKIGKLSGLLS